MNFSLEELAKKAGGMMRLASLLGVRHQSLYSWTRVPAGRVLEVERITGVSRHDLRPDLYPREPERAA